MSDSETSIEYGEKVFQANLREAMILLNEGYAPTRFEQFVVTVLVHQLVTNATVMFGTTRTNELISNINKITEDIVPEAQSANVSQEEDSR